MSKFNYGQAPLCVICGKHIGTSSNHAACSKKKQALHKLAKKNPAKVREEYPDFFVRGSSEKA